MAGEIWAPSTADVARHIPTRTRDASKPGDSRLLGDFTETTTPATEQAQAVIDSAVSWVVAGAGVMPPELAADDPVLVAARTAAEWRAAADIEVAYPNRDADVRLYQLLDARANSALAALLSALRTEQQGPLELVPEWNSPDPPPWADVDFDIVPANGVTFN